MILTLTLKVRLIFIRMLWNIIIGFKLDCTQCINGDPYAVKDRNCTGVRNYVRNHINALKRKACAIDWGMLVSNYCIEKYCLKWKSLVTFVFIGLGGVKFSCEPASKPYRNRCPQRVGVKKCDLKFDSSEYTHACVCVCAHTSNTYKLQIYLFICIYLRRSPKTMTELPLSEPFLAILI